MNTPDILTPVDIQQKEFRTKFRGYAPQEVDPFLDRVSAILQTVMGENESLKAELGHRQEELAEFKKREQLLKDTLINAQKVIEMMKANAQREAEIIIHEAELKAEKILQETFNRQARIKNEIADLQKMKAGLTEELRAIIEKFLGLLKPGEETSVSASASQ